MTTIIQTIVNEADGIEARIALIDGGRYSVALYDLDAEDYYPMAYIFATIEAAVAKAEEIQAAG